LPMAGDGEVLVSFDRLFCQDCACVCNPTDGVQ
jgi:hypothetical protein